MSAKEGPTLITSVQRALRLMEAVGGHEGGAPAKQLARETGLAPATAYHLLRTLANDGYIRKMEDGSFVLGERLDALYDAGRTQTQISRVRPTLGALRDDLSAAAYLTFYDDGEIRVADIVDSTRAPRAELWVGFEDAGHATALGKCVLRELDDEGRQEYLARHSLADLTPKTITHREELLRRLDALGDAPAVTDHEEYSLGVVCVAVPVYRGDTVGSLGVSLRADRTSLTAEEATVRLLAAANRVSRGLSLTI